MKIRNDRHVAVIVPSRHLAIAPGGEAGWPDDLPVPDGFSRVPDEPTKVELLAHARKLGLDVSGRDSRKAIAEAIAEATAASTQDDSEE